MVERINTRSNDCAREGLSTCRKIKDSGLHGESFPASALETHSEAGRVIKVRPELIIRTLKV